MFKKLIRFGLLSTLPVACIHALCKAGAIPGTRTWLSHVSRLYLCRRNQKKKFLDYRTFRFEPTWVLQGDESLSR